MRCCLLIALGMCLCREPLVEATIIKVSDIQVVHRYAKEGSLICLGIDDSLVFPKQMLGQTVWFNHRNQELMADMTAANAKEKALCEWMGIVFLADYELVHPQVSSFFLQLASTSAYILGISIRPLPLVSRTLSVLQSLGLDFTSCTAIQKSEGIIPHVKTQDTPMKVMTIENNVLFTGSMINGLSMDEVLTAFLDTLSVYPKQIVYVDSDENRLKSVEIACRWADLYYVGILYTPAVKRVENYDARLTVIQWEQLLKCFSDDYYMMLLNSIAPSVIGNIPE
ncbi:DUF2608 domain-containing protein [Candidatus Chlamydia sanziniae]|uniref:Uncharacterized protein n=1 Tax=Candidatus Chlamydia sanziniae TaxID=1806891 RepID=A0A1A9HVT9_9CHLA|nr:DUF2608 domain-containing protein [Candidatus Chlamydia sanziniae]ANH78223.1 hypothetical protein Cs308_0047 [Candidatus Chlamydia sanziniae]